MAETGVAVNGVCDQHAIHQDRVLDVRDRMQSDEVYCALADLFAAMGDPTRVRIIDALAQRELCVCDLAAVLGLSVSAVSHQLRLLRNLRLVKYRRAGRLAYYSLDDAHVYSVLNQGLEHVADRETPPAVKGRAGVEERARAARIAAPLVGVGRGGQ